MDVGCFLSVRCLWLLRRELCQSSAVALTAPPKVSPSAFTLISLVRLKCSPRKASTRLRRFAEPLCVAVSSQALS